MDLSAGIILKASIPKEIIVVAEDKTIDMQVTDGFSIDSA